MNQILPGPGGGDLSGFADGISAGYDFWRTSRFVLGLRGVVVCASAGTPNSASVTAVKAVFLIIS